MTLMASSPPRYSSKPFPPYRFVPGKTPHPTRDPDGHSYNKEPEQIDSFDPEYWNSCEAYLYGVDLFNYGFWWEAHESLEGVWVAAGRHTETGLFIQGLIQISVAYLKAFQGFHDVAKRMASKGLEKMGRPNECYLGVDMATFGPSVEASFTGDSPTPIAIKLVAL